MNAVINLHKSRLCVPRRVTGPATGPMQRTPPVTTPRRLVAPGSRVVLVAPHPDDEIIAMGATIAALARDGHEILIVAVTDGEGSHPQSSRWTEDELRRVRPLETDLALQRMGIRARVLRLGLPDGGLQQHEKALAGRLPIEPDDTVFVTWRHDGHPDHEACARASLAACRTVGAVCIEFPVWSLVPSHPAHARLQFRTLQEVCVPADLVQAKRHAMGAFASQLSADGDTAPVLHGEALDSWLGRSEWILA